VSRGLRALAWTTAVALGAAGLGGCTAGPPSDSTAIRLWTDDFYIRVTSDPMPPRALEQVAYTIVVLDSKTRQPIDGGEGRIFATNEDRQSKANGFAKAPEPGTYRTTMFFPTSGTWAMGIQFRRDSTLPLQRTNDWMQDVLAAAPPGQDAAPARPGQ
jgi:hypothetical protein